MRCEKCKCKLPKAVQLDPAEIIFKGSLFFDLPVHVIASQKRDGHIKEARQMLMAILREFTSLSLVKVGEMFGDRDHTTVIHAVKIVRTMCHTEDAYSQKYINLKHYITPVGVPV